MAANAGSIRAGRAYVEVGASDSKLRKVLDAAAARLKAFGASVASVGAKFAGLGAAMAAPMFAAAKAFADTGSELADMSARTGLSVEALGQLGHAATQTGTDLATVEGAAKKLQKNLVAAAEGSTEAQAEFMALGLSVESLLKMKPDQQFQAVAKAIAKIPNPAAKTAAAMSLMGKSGTALIPLIDDFDALTGEAKALGLVMSAEDAAAADALGDAMDIVVKVIKRAAVVIGSALAPILTDVAGTITRIAKTCLDWVAANKPLITTVFKVAAGVIAAGAAMVVLGGAISGIGSIIGGVVAGFGAIGAIITFVLSPIGLLTAAVAGLGAWFFTSTEAGGQALAWLGDRFGDLLGTAKTAFGGIADALQAGNIELAGKILWKALNVAWLEGVASLTEIWGRLKIEAAASILSLSANVQKIWAEMISDMTGSWGTMFATILKKISPFAGAMEAVFGGSIADKIDESLKSIGVAGETDAQKQARADALKAAQKKIDADKSDQIAALRNGPDDPALAKAQADLKAAQDELEKLVNKAAGGKAGLDVAGPAKAKLDGLDFTPESLDAGIAQASRKVETKGSFSASALRGLSAGDSVANDQLKEQEKTTKQLEKLNDKARQGRLVFS